jgi:hypothetical protein
MYIVDIVMFTIKALPKKLLNNSKNDHVLYRFTENSEELNSAAQNNIRMLMIIKGSIEILMRNG